MAAPTKLEQFNKPTQKGICKRVCRQGYTLCDSWWKFYRKPSTPGRFLACATQTVIYPLGWLVAGVSYSFGGLEATSTVLGITGSIGKGVRDFLDHTLYSDSAACRCPTRQDEGDGWWSWFMKMLFGDEDGVLEKDL